MTTSSRETYIRLVDICEKYKLHHLGSYFSSIPILEEIYSNMNLDDDVFILSSGHAAVALYVILERYYGFDAEQLLKDHGEHPKLDEKRKVYCSTGSLGMGLPVAVGRAMANKDRNVFCLISDGECAEGSIWESLEHIERLSIRNMFVYVNMNGISGYNEIDKLRLSQKLKAFKPDIKMRFTDSSVFGLFNGIESHYLNFDKESAKKVRDKIEKRFS